jgi:hypothetical protein
VTLTGWSSLPLVDGQVQLNKVASLCVCLSVLMFNCYSAISGQMQKAVGPG